MQAEFLIPMSFFAMIFGIVYLVIRKKERTLLIQRGADASAFESKGNKTTNLKWGLLLLGIGTGILLGRIFASHTCLGEEASLFSMVCLCGGLSLVIYHFIVWRMDKQNLPPNE